MEKRLNASTIVLLLLFYLGWGKWPVYGDAIYYVDYIVRSIMLIIIWQERHVLLTSPVWPPFKTWMRALSFVAIFLLFHQAFYYFQFAHDLNAYLYEPKTFPPIENSFLLIFDMTIGLMLVAITEEFVFRYRLNEWLKSFNANLSVCYTVTATLFALIHAPQGLLAIATTLIWGLFFFTLYQKTKSLHFVIVLHFITNFIVFGLMALESPAWN